MTQPIVGALLAAVLASLFLGLTIWAQQIRMDRISEDQTHTLASLVSDDVLSEDSSEVIAMLSDAIGGRFAIVLNSGDVIAGNPDILGRNPVHSAPLLANGTPYGRLVTHRLQAFQFVLPPEVLLGLFAFAIACAYGCGRIYTTFVLNGIREIENAFERSGTNGGEPRFTFSELTRLRFQMERRIRDLARTSDRLARLAYQNPDSDLPNLRAFYEAVEKQLTHADFENPLAVVFLDLDEFQKGCEIIGFSRAKTLVQLTKKRIEGELDMLQAAGLLDRRNCLLAHVQGDEFALLLPAGTGRDVAAQVNRNLRRAFVAPFQVGNRNIELGLSGGVALAPDDGDRAVDLLRRSQAALRSLRDENKEGFAFYQARLDRMAERRFRFSSEIRDAVGSDAFWPAFQPKIDLRTGAISGCEALARWTRNDGSLVSPADFIPAAEQSGLIVDIGEAILRKSCKAAAGWIGMGYRVPVAVNVSPAQLVDPTFCDRVLDAVTDAGLPPSMLELEITESMAVKDRSHVESVLNPLRRMGVRLAIDDFGTGHANLSIITQLDFDVFKIDRSFIATVTTETSASPIVEMILAMANTLGHDTVAEGVETPAQVEFLRRKGCAHAQGFYYCGPVQEARFREFLSKWRPQAAFPRVRKSA